MLLELLKPLFRKHDVGSLLGGAMIFEPEFVSLVDNLFHIFWFKSGEHPKEEVSFRHFTRRLLEVRQIVL
jgi:hypothetical protein